MEYIDPSKSRAWIQHHVQPYLSETKIACITVGNEVLIAMILSQCYQCKNVHGL